VTWAKGQSGNPAGRPKGSKHKLQTSFWKDLHQTWKENGAEALRRVAENDPSTFVRVCASLMPKEETVKQIEHAIEVTLKEPEWLKLRANELRPACHATSASVLLLGTRSGGAGCSQQQRAPTAPALGSKGTKEKAPAGSGALGWESVRQGDQRDTTPTHLRL